MSARNPSIERQLEERLPGQWRFERELPLDFVDAEGSLRSRTIRGRYPEGDIVEHYRQAMARGDEFPAILTTGELRISGLFVIDGLMIYLAARALGRATHAAYVVPLDALADEIDYRFFSHNQEA